MDSPIYSIAWMIVLAGALVVVGCDDEDEVDDVDAGDVADAADTRVDGEVGPPGDAADAPETGAAVREVDCEEVDADVTVEMVDFDFEPAMGAVEVGDVVEWTNEGDVAHTSTSGAPDENVGNVWDSGTVSPGDSYCVEFRSAGTYAYFCELHPERMQATMTVE